MNSFIFRTNVLVSGLLCAAATAACSSQQNSPQSVENVEELPPNSFDKNEESAKESAEVAEERRWEAAEEATEDVDNASVIESGDRPLTTDEVDTELDD